MLKNVLLARFLLVGPSDNEVVEQLIMDGSPIFRNGGYMKKFVCALAIALAVESSWSIDVNRGELESAGNSAEGSSVEFENYGGPHAVIESAKAIRDIGGALGRSVAGNVSQQATFGEGAKYTLVHAVTEEEKGKLDADILILNKNAGVDHIVNLRRIVSGFLSEAYGYSDEDSLAIATFVTVYNAVYRGNIDAFRGKYKENVLSFLDDEKIGLSTNWEEWAGHTQIVIPLGDLDGVSAVETSVISDENVVQAIRESGDKGIAERTTLADIKEREGTDAQQKAADAQKEATEKKPAAAAAKQESRKEPLNEEKRKKAEEAQKEVEKAQARSAEQQQIADRKRDESQTERENIKKDIRALSGQPDLSKESYVNGLVRTDEKQNLFEIVKIDAESGKVVRTSQVKNIRSGIFSVKNITIRNEDGEEKFENMYIAVCGTSDGRSAVKLCLIDTLTLEMKKESEETLADDSSFVQLGGDFFAVVNVDGDFYVGDYDHNLTLKKRSTVPVKPTTPISLTPKGLMVTDKSGTPVLLSVSALDSVGGSKQDKKESVSDAK